MADTSAIVRALVSRAQTQNAADPAGTAGTTWLTGIRDQALDAILAGDEEVLSLSFEGGSSNSARRFNSQALLEATQLALEELGATAPESSALIHRGMRFINL